MSQVQTMTLDEFQAAYQAQAPSPEKIVFKCPMCGTLQTAEDLIAAGAGETFDDVERYLGFSCVGRWTGAGSPRRERDGQACNWTLGGLFQTHKLEVITPDGERHARFELATKEEADEYRARKEGADHG